MATVKIKKAIPIVFFFICLCISENESGQNSSISTFKIPDDNDPEGGFDKILYSFLDDDHTVLNQYLQIVRDIFLENLFSEKLSFLKDIRLKCLPKIYFRLRQIKFSEFINCQQLNINIINVFGKRILDSCKKSDSFVECLSEAQLTLKREVDAMEEDILEIYLNEVVGGKETCMADIMKQLKIFHDFIQIHCKP